VTDPDTLAWSLQVGGHVVQQGSTGGRVRNVAQLVAAVGEFMTFAPGDVLLLGRGHALATVHAGQAVVASIEGIGKLHCSVAAEVPA
jgi:2-keto-4-pentenoate hydratase/2-oxohepta-3-ene-1,7-dioic acid hydratase in catechol pathway